MTESIAQFMHSGIPATVLGFLGLGLLAWAALIQRNGAGK